MIHLLASFLGALVGAAVGYGMGTHGMLAGGQKPPVRPEWVAPNIVPLTPDDVRRRLGIATTTNGIATTTNGTLPWSGPPIEVLN